MNKAPLATRMRIKWLWLRHMGPVLFAHKPMCHRFSREVVRVGRWRVCRSCACVYAGGVLATMVLSSLGGNAAKFNPVGLLAWLAITLTFSVPTAYAHMPRLARDLLRFSTGALVAASAFACVRGPAITGLVTLLTLFACWCIYRRLRAAGRRDPCEGCAELGDSAVCPGYAPHAERFERFDEEASALLAADAAKSGCGTQFDSVYRG